MDEGGKLVVVDCLAGYVCYEVLERGQKSSPEQR